MRSWVRARDAAETHHRTAMQSIVTHLEEQMAQQPAVHTVVPCAETVRQHGERGRYYLVKGLSVNVNGSRLAPALGRAAPRDLASTRVRVYA